MGPKCENVEKALVLPLLLKGQEGHGYTRAAKDDPSRRGPTSKKKRFFIKHASCRSSELCFLRRRGRHFHKNHENMSGINETCCQNHVGYSKISPTWGRMH